jgi:prepilin-type processing-associated H-X9-DG protein
MDILSLRKRGEIPAIMDCVLPYGQCGPNDEPPSSENHYGNDIKCFCINRHNGYVNSLFLDWSVRKIGLKELWTLKWDKQYDTAGPWTRAGGVQTDDWPEWMRNFKDY